MRHYNGLIKDCMVSLLFLDRRLNSLKQTGKNEALNRFVSSGSPLGILVKSDLQHEVRINMNGRE